MNSGSGHRKPVLTSAKRWRQSGTSLEEKTLGFITKGVEKEVRRAAAQPNDESRSIHCQRPVRLERTGLFVFALTICGCGSGLLEGGSGPQPHPSFIEVSGSVALDDRE